jgi:GNAT superfamily N-acetyltransferase
LRAAGFVPEDRETVVVGVAETMRRTVPLPESVTLREVRDRGDLERIAAMETEVWERDFTWLADDLEGRIQSAPEQIVVIVAEANDQMVSAAWLVFRADCDFAGLWGGSTLENWRGKGIYHALVAHRAHIAAERGVRYLQVDASDESLPILLRLGFEAITTTTPYVWTPPVRA